LISRAVWGFAVALILSGCQSGAPGFGAREVILDLRVSNARIRAGETVVVSWTSSGLQSLTLNGVSVPSAGSEVHHGFTSSTTYRLLGISDSGRRYLAQAEVLVDTVELIGSVVIGTLPLSAATSEALESLPDEGEDIVPGEYLLLLAPDAILPASVAVNSVPLSDTPHVRLLRTDEDTNRSAQIGSLSNIPGLLAAIPNRYLTRLASPNDEHYPLQWSLNGTRDPRFDLTPLWSTTRGSRDVTIAVIDTGIVRDPTRADRSHPDLECGRLLPGASFLRALDGSTTYASDAFESLNTSNGYHGTHVAGIAAACSDNRIGISGVDPSAQLLPIRVFDDRGNGTLAQVLVASRWAAGLSVPGMPTNPHPADIINLSLGAGGACSDTPHPVASVLAAVAATGTILVAAAGNTGASSALTPANCPSVISVGAVGPSGQVASYSNRGPAVDYFAPGGDMTSSERERGILSTLASETGEPAYAFMDGTSMAAPYVTGLISLLLSIHPDLHSQQVRGMLSLASDTTTVSCRIAGRPTTCEAAVIDPRKLVTVAVPPRQATDDLSLSGSRDFGPTATRVDLSLSNGSRNPIAITSLRSPTPYLTGELYGSATVPSGAQRSIVVTLDRNRLASAGVRGTRETLFSIETDLGTLTVPLRFDLGGDPSLGTITITAAVEAAHHGGGAIRRTTTTTDHTRGYAFSLDLDLAGLQLTAGDHILLQARGNPPAECPNGQLVGEIRLPIDGIESLRLADLLIPSEFNCPRAAAVAP